MTDREIDEDDDPIVPDFTPVSAGQIFDHMDQCPVCQGRFSALCPEGEALWARWSDLCRREREREPKAQAWELIRAGWRFELPGPADPPVMSWYWRSPPRRKGSAGKLHRSTNQAWRAMMKARGA